MYRIVPTQNTDEVVDVVSQVTGVINQLLLHPTPAVCCNGVPAQYRRVLSIFTFHGTVKNHAMHSNVYFSLSRLHGFSSSIVFNALYQCLIKNYFMNVCIHFQPQASLIHMPSNLILIKPNFTVI